VQPALEALDRDIEEVSASLGASRWRTLCKIVVPSVLPAWLTGLALAFARAVGEFGSVYFIAGNMPMKTEIAPLLIIIRLEEFDYVGAAAIGSVMLVAAFAMLLLINLVQRWSRIHLEK
jgi:sulfate/thiosulfate transport system permease protein